MNRDDRTVFLHAGVIAFLIVMTAAAFASEPNCAKLKSNIARYGVEAVKAWAQRNGYTEEEIARARRVCRV